MSTETMDYRTARYLEALEGAVGRRALVRTGSARVVQGEPTECRVLEIAPSGLYVRVEWCSGDRYWRSVADMELVEVLPDPLTPGGDDAAPTEERNDG